MTTAWRLCRRPYADLSGDGARLYGGRWNSPGVPVVYAADHPALAVLEVRVHLDVPPDLLPDDYVMLTVALAGVPIEALASVPDDQRAAGDAWVASGRSAVLRVPSIIVADAFNYLINPRHPLAANVGVAGVRPFLFDERLWAGA